MTSADPTEPSRPLDPADRETDPAAHPQAHPQAGAESDLTADVEAHAPDTASEHERPLGRPGDRLRVRRSVNFPAFLLTGAFVGFVLGGLIDFLGPTAVDPQTGAPLYTSTSAFSTLAVMFALAGALIAAIVALVLDRRG